MTSNNEKNKDQKKRLEISKVSYGYKKQADRLETEEIVPVED